MHTADIRRIRAESDHANVIVGWGMILLITVAGFSALAYALGKFAGMSVCR